ncbi:MAG: flagellar motor switch protein FliG [Rhodospirillaceae bacterium]|jgi:flagellar motor switch protein FliG|nr:flagellar motor switch protein FliG [Rhodospirillaceae bacterium]MBT5082353.1 flagellar motor switch protein FliG [Rhodospirillaceae bacterium]MBT5522654.1 flagellar motor switch protein FliG [Rhodospirillaceae bacterium]MBT5881242.1 flagellar motor switch protein FliG [Rhodospirillaceae bacterium]MBT6983880.1 flagellar motor switch protein FliG [Rhodospirillaceae bacterium]
MAGELKSRMEELTGPEKAAVIMLALGNDHGAPLWPLMDDEEIRDISMAMANLGKIDPEVIELLVVDFATQMSTTGTIVGSMDSTERLLRDILPNDRVDTILEEIRGPAGRTMWDKLSNVNEMVLANYLRNEYPQTVAVVLSKIRSEHAARVLSSLPEDFALEVVMRMLRMESVQKDILDKVERTLRVEFMNNLARTNRRDSHELMADIFNNLDRNAEGRFMASLEERNRDAAEKIKALMFTFEDLLRLDPGGVQTLIRGVENNRLALALKGSSDSIRDLFFSNMSERAAKILREDMDAMGPVRLRDVDESQSEIVAAAKDLADRGEIMLADNKDDDELIY